MKPQKIIFLCLLPLTVSIANAQDTIKTKMPKPERPHEIGIGVATPLCLLMGVTDYSGRFTNLTYRQWLDGKRAIRAFVGANFVEETDPYTQPYNSGIIPTSEPLVYSTKRTTRPTNFQIGVGYEYMSGGRLKHGPGIDLVYNNVFEKTEYFDMKVYQTSGPNNSYTDHYDRLDSGAYVKGVTTNKFGFNLSYSLRYEMTKRWVFTASAMGSFRVATVNAPTGKSTNFDFNMVALLSDISLFYRF